MAETDFKTRLEELTEEELEAVNTQLALIANTSEAHLAYMEDADELTYDDYGLQILEEGFLFLYQAWITQLQDSGRVPKERTLN